MSLLFPPATARSVDILSLGDPNIDLVFGVDEVPVADQKCVGKRLGSFAGGTTANVACAAARLGARTSVYGQIGDDAEGQFLKAEFERFEVATDHLRVIRGARSATALIMVNGEGEKALIYVPMAPDSYKSLPDALLGRSRVLYAMPYETAAFAQLATRARAQGVAVVIDIEPAMVTERERFEALLAVSDVVFFSASSFRAILRTAPTTQSLEQLLRKGPRAVIVTLGAQGAVAVTPEGVVRQSAFPSEVLDSTGAGDCFIGALLAAALEGQALQEAMRFSCAAASLSLAAVGARSGLPDRATLARLL